MKVCPAAFRVMLPDDIFLAMFRLARSTSLEVGLSPSVLTYQYSAELCGTVTVKLASELPMSILASEDETAATS
ncbi:MAG: hypothetical protein E6G87_06860 [Alphaproteobacteria bacterium]|nr:MAG: hypothetical protein E6G87_06860 [Alphaproteobacteria bacterium]